MKVLLEFNAKTFGKADIFLQDMQMFKLGNMQIQAIHAPGHSPGSVCFYIDNALFSGDVLFYRKVGRTDVQNSSPEDQVLSVLRLYNLFPDSTKVYPGHGQYTVIGIEKIKNDEVRVERANLEN